MSPTRRRYGTGDTDLDAEIETLVARIADDVGANADLIQDLVISSLRLARDHASRGDLKIASAALKEMRYSFHIFDPYRTVLKASIFGSARTKPDDPLYDQARRLAAALSERSWMVITGAGPGIMAAGVEGAGAERAFGVSIRLPFESVTPGFDDDDPKLINFRYFFTRKLTFIKESDGFVLLPGGFGTLDEAFELLTLIQTGKAQPAPVVLLDVPGGTYWSHWLRFVEAELASPGYINPGDLALLRITDDIDLAVDELTGFYANYRSLRFVGERLVLRMAHAPRAGELAKLNDEFADIVVKGKIERIEPTKAEVAGDDLLDAERLAFGFDRRSWARLRQLIDVLNDRPSSVGRR